jgi:hypothetical protein
VAIGCGPLETGAAQRVAFEVIAGAGDGLRTRRGLVQNTSSYSDCTHWHARSGTTPRPGRGQRRGQSAGSGKGQSRTGALPAARPRLLKAGPSCVGNGSASTPPPPSCAGSRLSVVLASKRRLLAALIAPPPSARRIPPREGRRTSLCALYLPWVTERGPPQLVTSVALWKSCGNPK